MTITTEICKQAICDKINSVTGGTILSTAYNGSSDIKSFLQHCWLEDNQGNQIPVNNISDVINQAGNPKNWKRFSKESILGQTGSVRGFDCRPFGDQLRAYVWDDGNKILKIEIEGE